MAKPRGKAIQASSVNVLVVVACGISVKVNGNEGATGREGGVMEIVNIIIGIILGIGGFLFVFGAGYVCGYNASAKNAVKMVDDMVLNPLKERNRSLS